MVIDTSAILAVFFNEEKATRISKLLSDNAQDLKMSTVNLAETIILIKDRQPKVAPKLEEFLLRSPINFVPVTYTHAQVAAYARLKYPLNLGDCFAYALAKEENLPLLTLDLDFKKTDLNIVQI